MMRQLFYSSGQVGRTMAVESIRISKRVKGGLALVVIAASTVYGVHTLWRFKRGLPRSRAPSSAQSLSSPGDAGTGAMEEGLSPRPPLTPFPQENLRQVVRHLAEELQLSPEQKLQLAQVWLGGSPQSPEELQQRLRQTREHLAPNQRETLQRFLDSRVAQRVLERREVARRALPPEQFKIYEEGLGEVEAFFLEVLSDQASS